MWSKWSSKIKNKLVLEITLNLKIYFIYTVYSYRTKKSLHLNLCYLFLPKKSQILYSGHLIIAGNFFGTARVRYRQVWLCHINKHTHTKTRAHTNTSYKIEKETRRKFSNLSKWSISPHTAGSNVLLDNILYLSIVD